MAIDVRTTFPTLEVAVPTAPRRIGSPQAGMPVLCTDGRAGVVERVLFDRATGTPRELVVRTGRFFVRCRVVPASWVVGVDNGAVTLGVSRAELGQQPAHRSDGQVLAELQSRLRDDDPIRALGLRPTRIEVVDGDATLSGRVPSRLMARRMLDIARGTPGVRHVVDRLVADDALEIAVARAIGRAPATRDSRLVIRADRGHVTVGGAFLSADVQAEAVRIASTVDGVAGATPGPRLL